MKRVFLSALVATAISTAPGAAQQQPTPTDQRQRPTEQRPQPATRQGGPDQQFLSEMAHGNIAEIELGRLAQDKAASAAVKQFGKRLVTDHSRALDELKMIAADKNMTLPATADPKHKAVKDTLSGMSGQRFDRAFAERMVQAHTDTLNKLQRAAKSFGDLDVKAWAAKTLPTVEEHLELAKNLSGRAVGTSGEKKK
jgi:putative membrane protein